MFIPALITSPTHEKTSLVLLYLKAGRDFAGSDETVTACCAAIMHSEANSCDDAPGRRLAAPHPSPSRRISFTSSCMSRNINAAVPCVAAP